VNNFFRSNKIPVSQQAINLIVQRARGDRLNLSNELQKIKSYTSVKKKTINILNENNYTLEDCILIIRTFLIKSKRLIKLNKEFKKTKNIDETILSSKPPIFWKEKEIVKQQLKNWPLNEIEKLTYQINEVELLVKKYNTNSISILFDFIIETASPINS